MSIGTNIKKRRFELGMSQQELANAMGYKTRSTIAKIESGENDVSQLKLQRFAKILDTSVEALILGYSIPEQERRIEMFNDLKVNKNIVVVLAGGKTTRNSQNIPCQFIDINGKPVIIHCLEVYQSHAAIDDIYIVCQKGWRDIVDAYIKRYEITKVKGLISAGNTAIESLKNAIDSIKHIYDPRDAIMVQEATRPLITSETISKLLQVASEHESATICHSMEDYVQFNVTKEATKYLDRNTIVALQSPEIHKLSSMIEIFEIVTERKHFLSESCYSMLLYNLGHKINFVESNINNIKITREEDLAMLKTVLSKR